MVVAQPLKYMPWWTIAYVASVAAIQVIPGLSEYLIYDRSALAHGELWRLFSAHMVHFSSAHLLNNLLVLAPAALLVEMRYREDFVKVVAVSALAIGLALYLFQANIDRYAGASGISLALLVYGALRGLWDRNRRWRIVCSVVLAVVATKITAEILFDWQTTDWENGSGFVTVTLSHVTGTIVGMAIGLARTSGCGQHSRLAKRISGSSAAPVATKVQPSRM